jgi:hypothetical protein
VSAERLAREVIDATLHCTINHALACVLSAPLLSIHIVPTYSQDAVSVSGFSKTQFLPRMSGSTTQAVHEQPPLDVSAIRNFDSVGPTLTTEGSVELRSLRLRRKRGGERPQDLDLVLAATPTWASARPQETEDEQRPRISRIGRIMWHGYQD